MQSQIYVYLLLDMFFHITSCYCYNNTQILKCEHIVFRKKDGHLNLSNKRRIIFISIHDAPKKIADLETVTNVYIS
jgi:hypothetical protein